MRKLASQEEANDTPLLDVRGVSKSFGGISVLRDLSLTVNEGDLLCIIGPNGCGKTTLYNVISGALPPTEGRVFIDGLDVTGRKPEFISRLGVSRKFQVPGVYPELSVVENIEIPLAARNAVHPFATLGLRPDMDVIDELVELCGLRRKWRDAAATLSHGEKQWLEVAMLIASDAGLILLDEPTAGMSVVETRETADLIGRLRKQFGRTVVIIEHDMTFVRLLDCPVAVMLNGQIIRTGDYREVSTDERVIEAYLGTGTH